MNTRNVIIRPIIDADLVALLPPVALELVALIGFVATSKLVAAWGGTVWPVSRNRRSQGQRRYAALAEVVGEVAAAKLTSHYGGFDLSIPKCEKAIREARNRLIRAEFDQMTGDGWSALDTVFVLSPRFNLTTRQVWNVLKQPNYVPPIQADLFG